MLVISGTNKNVPTLRDSRRRALHIKTILLACILMVLLLHIRMAPLMYQAAE
jgi:hypothetical protein